MPFPKREKITNIDTWNVDRNETDIYIFTEKKLSTRKRTNDAHAPNADGLLSAHCFENSP